MTKEQKKMIRNVIGLYVMPISNYLHYYSRVHSLRVLDGKLYVGYNDVGIKIKKAVNFNHIVGMLAANGYLLVPNCLYEFVEYDLFRAILKDGEFKYCDSCSNNAFKPIDNNRLFDWLARVEFNHRQCVKREILRFTHLEMDKITRTDLFTIGFDIPPTKPGRNRQLNFISFIRVLFSDELFLSVVKDKHLTIDWLIKQYNKYYTDSFHIGHLSLPNYNLIITQYDLSNWYETNKKRYTRQQNKQTLRFELEDYNYGNN